MCILADIVIAIYYQELAGMHGYIKKKQQDKKMFPKWFKGQYS